MAADYITMTVLAGWIAVAVIGHAGSGTTGRIRQPATGSIA